MKLGMQLGLGPGHIVLDGYSAPPLKGQSSPPPNFGPCLLWPNGWMDHGQTWYEGRPHPRPHCVRWRLSSPQKGHCSPPPISAHVYCGQTVGWIKIKLGTKAGLGPGHIVRWGPSSPPPKEHGPPKFSAHVCCGQTAGCIKMPLGTKVGLGPRHIVFDGDPALPQKGAQSPNFRPMSVVAKRSPISDTAHHLFIGL